MTPAWLLDAVAALMLGVAAVSAARLAAARPWRRGAVVIDTDVAHLLMAIAMAGMLVSGLATLPDTVWEVIFGVMTVWFACRVIRDARANRWHALAGGHCAPHLVHSAAMLYMFLALAAPAGAGAGQGMGGMGGMGGSPASGMASLDLPTLGLVFALILVGYTVWDIDQLSGQRAGLAVSAAGQAVALAGVPANGAGTRPVAFPGRLSPGTAVACRIAMGAAMTFMLLVMI